MERPLTERGIADACVASDWFESQQWSIDHALVSVAERTRETFRVVSEQLSYSVPHDFHESIYEASPGEILALVRQQSVENVLVVGHAPGIPRLAVGLAGGELPHALLVGKGYPSAAISVLESSQPWTAWEPECAEFVEYIVPRANPHGTDID